MGCDCSGCPQAGQCGQDDSTQEPQVDEAGEGEKDE